MSNPTHNNAIHAQMLQMRTALRTISKYGDCFKHDEKLNGALCDCSVCIAKAALDVDEASDWRFQSTSMSRLQRNPREAALVDAWRRYFTSATMPDPDSVIKQILNMKEVTPRDWLIMTSIVQWLGTNVGTTSILEQAGFHHRDDTNAAPGFAPSDVYRILDDVEAEFRTIFTSESNKLAAYQVIDAVRFKLKAPKP